MWEYPGVTSYTHIRLAHPSRSRPYWGLWTKTYCPMAEEFIHRVESAHLRIHLPYDANDNVSVAIALLMNFLLNILLSKLFIGEPDEFRLARYLVVINDC